MGDAAMLDRLSEAVVRFDEEGIEGLCEKALASGVEPREAILNGLARGMRRVGELYEEQTYGIPEVLLCADVLNMGMEVLKPHAGGPTGELPFRIVIGTVEGDIHSIGKNIVRLMLEVGGFDVVDLGEDVPPARFLEEIEREGVDVVALSTMMTTTLASMKATIDAVRESHPSMRFIVGGASVTGDTAARFGANGYAENATAAVEAVRRMLLV